MNNDKQTADGNQPEHAHEEMIPEGKVETIVDAPADTGLNELEAALAEAMARHRTLAELKKRRR